MNKRVLVVDDDPVIRLLTGEYLNALGHTVEVLDNGTDCLAKLAIEVPDILVLDMFMPDMTGIDVLQNIRANPNTAKLPVILLSANTDSKKVAIENGVSADHYLQKPFNVQEIVAALEAVLAPQS